jgi:hypothetical protein
VWETQIENDNNRGDSVAIFRLDVVRYPGGNIHVDCSTLVLFRFIRRRRGHLSRDDSNAICGSGGDKAAAAMMPEMWLCERFDTVVDNCDQVVVVFQTISQIYILDERPLLILM